MEVVREAGRPRIMGIATGDEEAGEETEREEEGERRVG